MPNDSSGSDQDVRRGCEETGAMCPALGVPDQTHTSRSKLYSNLVQRRIMSDESVTANV
jgi:hypothetical protein